MSSQWFGLVPYICSAALWTPLDSVCAYTGRHISWHHVSTGAHCLHFFLQTLCLHWTCHKHGGAPTAIPRRVCRAGSRPRVSLSATRMPLFDLGRTVPIPRPSLARLPSDRLRLLLSCTALWCPVHVICRGSGPFRGCLVGKNFGETLL
jgi:hypothetical protein